jgi:hypothetical protein
VQLQSNVHPIITWRNLEVVLLQLREIRKVFPPSLRPAGFRALALATHLGSPIEEVALG